MGRMMADSPSQARCRRARFARQRRVRKRREFLAAQRSGVRVPCRHFVLLVAVTPAGAAAHRRSSDDDAARLGLVASRKVGSSTLRNRVKRLVREWFRQRLAQLPNGVDLLVLVKPGAAALGFGDVTAELDAAMPRVCRVAAQLRAQRPTEHQGSGGFSVA